MSIRKLNISKTVCDHLLSPNHKESHRMAVGLVIVFTRVLISKIPTSYHMLHLVYDAGGYFVYAVGSIPFIEHLMSKIKDNHE